MGRVYNPFVSIDSQIPLIVYPFEGVEKVTNKRDLQLFMNIIFPNFDVPKSTLYGIVFPFLREEKLAIDFHFYHGFEDNWRKSNPTIRDFPYFNERVNGRDNSCETTTIIRGREAIHRRHTLSLEQYLGERPLLLEDLSLRMNF